MIFVKTKNDPISNRIGMSAPKHVSWNIDPRPSWLQRWCHIWEILSYVYNLDPTTKSRVYNIFYYGI